MANNLSNSSTKSPIPAAPDNEKLNEVLTLVRELSAPKSANETYKTGAVGAASNMPLYPPHSHPLPPAVAASAKPIHLSDDERLAIEQTCNTTVNTGRDVVLAVARMATYTIAGMQLSLDADILARVSSRCPIHTTIRQHLEEVISDFLNKYVDGGY